MFTLDESEQIPILDAALSHANYGVNLMPGQKRNKLLRHVLVKENLQCWA